MPKRCQLTARAQMDGEVRESGYIFVLPDGERGPHRTVADGRDVPLYIELPEEPVPVAEVPVEAVPEVVATGESSTTAEAAQGEVEK